ncbi:CNNM domain-containing protein [Paraferrimonas sedimenticola]|uniref:Hemolysin n=1 Tax=Paraferrimonas sedimenticola TaxID=375674 RepID=A0AA37RUI3_9GAMM|nr:CNNM domain-containing protein [Paraferrimonas sedimenticola]GLP95099.1 hemolysin [Paraferrimonas sedimenticola]
MFLLTIYVLIAIGISFMCSIFEAVLLSITPSYVATLRKDKPKTAARMSKQKDNVEAPLAAILTLNTVAHTAGAAGAGAQAAKVFGDNMLGVFSAVLTLMILLLSEIIPKTLGANYWRALAPAVSLALVWLERLMWPLVWLSMQISKVLGRAEQGHYVRQELSAMADVGLQQGELEEHESKFLKKMLDAKAMQVTAVMTPRTVMFALDQQTSLKTYSDKYVNSPFSRIPVYQDEPDNIKGYVVRNDILLAEKSEPDEVLASLRKNLVVIPETARILDVFELLIKRHSQIAMVVDEYGDTQGIVTQEDIIESMLGLEIVDSNDPVTDMQRLARKLWQHRIKEKGIRLSDED